MLTGKELAEEDEDVSAFDGGLAQVKVTGKIGLIDRTGALVVPATFDGRFAPFREGLRATSVAVRTPTSAVISAYSSSSSRSPSISFLP